MPHKIAYHPKQLNHKPHSRWAFSGLLTDGEGQNGTPPQNLFHIFYNHETWDSYTLPKGDTKTV